MEAILKHSALNPLAACFVPSLLKKAEESDHYQSDLQEETKAQTEKIHDTTLVNIAETNPCQSVKNKNCDTVSCATSNITGPSQSVTEFIDDFMLCNDLEYANSLKNIDPVVCAANFLEIIFVTMFGFYCSQHRTIIQQNKAKVVGGIKRDKRERCTCPPMFGCVIPHDFFGNPLKLSSYCNKESVRAFHSDITPDLIPQRHQWANTMQDVCINDFSEDDTLENVVKEFKKVIEDICNMIKLNSTEEFEEDGTDSLESINFISEENLDCDFYSQTRFFEESLKTGGKRGSEAGSMSSCSEMVDYDSKESGIKILEDTPVILDDDFHALLDKIIPVDKEGIFPANKLETEISELGWKLPFDHKRLQGKKISNPLCSVWCNSQHHPCNDTYKKFIDSLALLEQNVCDSRIHKYSQNVFKKQLYRKLPGNSIQRNTKSFPLNVIHERCNNGYIRNGNIQSNCKPPKQKLDNYVPMDGAIGRKLNKGNSPRAGIWKSVDGQDSLWSPLPDCVPKYENIHDRYAPQRRSFPVVRVLERPVFPI